ncbi:MAG: hypothetical protein JNL42_20430 [Anaerolineae bacterium]|nr:hypothetical protein [Anaerolineae bacterium]
MRTIHVLFLFVALAALPLGAAAQKVCDPAYTATDYRFYALDAAAAGDVETAESLYACWEEAFPDDDKLYLDRSAVRAEIAGDFAGALADLERAEALTGSVLVSARRLAVMLAQGDYDAAVRLVEELQQDNRWRILGDGFAALRRAAYQGRAMALVEAGSHEAALADFEVAFEGLDEEDLTPADGPMVLAISEAFLATGQLEQAARGYTAYVQFMGSDADPEIVALVTALEENGVAAFFADDTAMRAELATGVATVAALTPFRFSGDGSVMSLYRFRERTLQLYDTADGAPLAAIENVYDDPSLYALNGDGSRVAVTDLEGRVTVRDSSTGDILYEVPTGETRANPVGLAFAGDGLIVLFRDGAVRRFDAETGKARANSELEAVIPPLAVVSFSSDGESAAVVDYMNDIAVSVYDLDSGRQTAGFEANGNQLSAWSGDLRFAVVVSNSRIGVWTPALGGSEVETFDFDFDISRSAGFDSAGEVVVYGDENGLITAINLVNGTRTVVGLHETEIMYAGVSPDGRLAAALDRDGTVRLWEIVQGG